MSRLITYSIDELVKLNVYSLRSVPIGSKYDTLRQFIDDKKQSNSKDASNHKSIPTYLLKRYGDISKNSVTITRGQLPSQPSPNAPIRRKLYVAKDDNPADQTNEKLHDILSKLSPTNKDKLLGEVMDMNIPDECGSTLINNMYGYAIELSYIINIYLDFIFCIKQKNVHLYEQLISKVIEQSLIPILSNESNVQSQLGNIKLMCMIHAKDTKSIEFTQITNLTHLYIQRISPEFPAYLTLLFELLKNMIHSFNENMISQIMKKINPITHDLHYSAKYRCLAVDIGDLCDNELDSN